MVNFKEVLIDYPISVVYKTGCTKSLEVVNFCRENSIQHVVLEYDVDKREKALRNETHYKDTPVIFDSEGWLICTYNSYKRVLGGEVA